MGEEIIMNYLSFLSKQRALLEAPAGYGKTHSIIKCLENCNGKQLILTHTHAGVASIKMKIKESQTDYSKFHIETIDSFALRLFKSHMGQEKLKILDQDDVWKNEGKNIKNAVSNLIKKSSIIKNVLQNTYAGVFVDEYQDCTISANALIEEISNIIPTRIFGDWLQGIFDFNPLDPLIQYDKIHAEFRANEVTLNTPWRWKNINEPLGNDIKSIRNDLKTTKKVNLELYTNIELITSENEVRTKCFSLLGKGYSILLIHPNKQKCRKIAQSLSYKFHVLESIDDKDFYSISKLFDNLSSSINFEKDFFLLLEKVFNKTSIETYYKNGIFVNKRNPVEKALLEGIKNRIAQIQNIFSFSKVESLITHLYSSCKFKLIDNRIELFKTLCSALLIAEEKKLSVLESTKGLRDKLRHVGRFINVLAIDTTLLTKGLEFDIVIVLEADNIGNSFGKYDIKKWYVAISRARKQLILQLNNKQLSFE